MSVRENLELYGIQDETRYVNTLTTEFGATKHPKQRGALILEGLPFYAPRFLDDHISILSFNNIPLPDALIQALVDHRELFPDNILIRWTQEQDLILEGTPGQLTGQTTSR
jgi:hypothetical protein